MKLRRSRLLQIPRGQPPSGGCVLKQTTYFPHCLCLNPAAFGRLCVETTVIEEVFASGDNQPPSGGCVLKLRRLCRLLHSDSPAAFGRLCVETVIKTNISKNIIQPPSGGCVLKRLSILLDIAIDSPAAFGRLCVETLCHIFDNNKMNPAAFGRLCVETDHSLEILIPQAASRLRAAVC